MDILTRSKNRVALLRIFFGNPEKAFYIRELSNMIGTSAGNTQKELRKLEEKGFIKSSRTANLRYYSINKEFNMLDEFKSIVSKTIGLESEMKKTFGDERGVKFAFIFGSYVNGKFKTASDIDIFLIGNVKEDKIIAKIRNLEEKTGREINFHIADKNEFLQNLKEKSFYKDIIKNYKLLTNNKDEFKKFIGES